ncbi:hypothetical protein NQ036_03830 [Brevibacterium sp. 91QC2O2]|uniref:hypothetical protein n=1 Tax=Brevibacterium TaxID=1696 RepID=UPI00211D1146|nr:MULTISPECIES: hypothetical protein [unclassified Brevibacterium]MCQ9367377.1 hypothetical protein [Brevibacterium sp. 91QC2O2]MCQ9384610.1 hypothetical protein [Brevibacterium sp. 68QC2CO]
MPTRDEAIAGAGQILARGLVRTYMEGTVAEAAARAYTPGGPPLAELEARIAALRAGALPTTIPAAAAA